MVNDYQFGIQNEISLKESIENITGTLNRTTKYHSFDYVGTGVFVELKSRNCLSTTYDTTMVGMNKINKIKSNLIYYFFFKFIDGLFYWKYRPNEYLINQGGRYDRGKAEIRDYLYIPVKDLTLTTLI